MIVNKTVEATVSGVTGTATYTFSKTDLVNADYTGSKTGTTTGGTVSATLAVDDQVDENGTLTLSVTDDVCTKTKDFNFVYTTPVAFSLKTDFKAQGTGGGDCEYSNGVINLIRLINGAIPGDYTVDVKIDGVIRDSSEYVISWNGTNYELAANGLGAASLSSGTHDLVIKVTQLSDNTIYNSQVFTLPNCN